jgi:hypothetical protein
MGHSQADGCPPHFFTSFRFNSRLFSIQKRKFDDHSRQNEITNSMAKKAPPPVSMILSQDDGDFEYKELIQQVEQEPYISPGLAPVLVVGVSGEGRVSLGSTVTAGGSTMLGAGGDGGGKNLCVVFLATDEFMSRWCLGAIGGPEGDKFCCQT